MNAKFQFSLFRKALSKGLLVTAALASISVVTACSSSSQTDHDSPADLVREARVAKIIESLHQRNSDEVDKNPYWTEENERNYTDAVDSTDLIYDENTAGFIKKAPSLMKEQVVTDSTNEQNPEAEASSETEDNSIAPSSSSNNVVSNADKVTASDLKKTENKAGLTLKEAAALATSHQLNIGTIVPLNKRIELANPPAPGHAPFTTYSERKDNPDPNLRRLPDERDYPLQPFKNPLYYDNSPGTYHYRTYRQYNSSMESQTGSRGGNYFGK